ncbi:MAG: cytochrome c1 [Alphaproteobacteria bacterium]|jgi:cytochrome c1|nr:cytochrome c1 [Alphaproteobacteria bacterium]MBN9591443.1 cytochrome c1 [Alphaproteobacteria bacterium]
MRFALPLGLSVVALLAVSAPSFAAGTDARPVKDVAFSFEGPFGTYDRAALQRGFQVYKEVCSACHSLNRVSFHALADEGGPGFTEAQAKAIAASYKIPAEPNDQGQTVDENGERLTRPGILADHFPPPFPNENAARAANGGALPPDLSLVAKSFHHGPQFIYSILTGFHEKPPAGFKVQDGKYYNPYFPGGNISMPPPLSEDSVTYSDGTKATIEQEAHDVTTFLAWAAEPKMEQRKRMGFGVMAFLIVLSGLLFLSYRKVWADAH